jgi:flavin-dependent dehydrogenase
MQTCDVLIVGGGPAGSTCARALVREGADVLLLDKAVFPRDKLCAGWVTPAVFAVLEIDPADYSAGRTCQPITAFRTGRIGGPAVETDYGRPVSYAIRRAEFDHYLLARCGARLCLGETVKSVRQDASGWVINQRFSAPIVVAAGGHFCPVMRRLGDPAEGRSPVVVAQEIEFLLDARQMAACKVEPGVPELYFSPDLAGYGWCLRKGALLNVGLGREDGRGLSEHVRGFLRWLKQCGRVPPEIPNRFRGHAYYLYPHSPRRLSGEGVLAIGDAAGLAYAASGEGIRPAVESALMAAGTIRAAGGDYRGDRLKAYDEQIVARFGRRATRPPRHATLSSLRQLLAARLLSTRWFTRHVVLDRCFLRRHDRAT